MKTFILFVVLIFSSTSVFAQIANSESRIGGMNIGSEFDTGIKALKEHRYDVAEQHFRRSLELNPNQIIAERYLASALAEQFLADRIQNAQKGEQAFEIYQKILQQNPNDEETNRAFSIYLGLIKGDDARIQWLTERAENEQIATESRLEAYLRLVWEQHNCANEITENSRQRVIKDRKERYVFKKPANTADFDKLKQCTQRGHELIDQAIALNQNNDSAWSYKASLLVQSARIAEMDNDKAAKERFLKESDQAKARFLALSEEKARKIAAEEEKREKSKIAPH